ncbi:acylpyruvase FAHD1 [Pyrus ussuriensis x Pyrus communis]|uniref:Acylpyruvase FAHD1 n=1 Tax=Pyrus ussuriensis x Pyrus communis TaxID=2448454 RepID=A0A5N5G5E4_9ROSA|nr:acylpyruvase FAHD1 [Pyrus ussuriensis x Pyrus communis]
MQCSGIHTSLGFWFYFSLHYSDDLDAFVGENCHFGYIAPRAGGEAEGITANAVESFGNKPQEDQEVNSKKYLSLANKQLRFVLRFLMVCLLLNWQGMVRQLLNQLRVLVDECKRTFQEPVLFLKPSLSYLMNGGTIEVPHPLLLLDHEVVVIISQKARNVRYALALDMTAREIQASAKIKSTEIRQRKRAKESYGDSRKMVQVSVGGTLDLCLLCV